MPISLNILSKFDAKGIKQAQTGLDKLGKAAGGFAAAGVAAFASVAVGVGAFVVASAKQLMEIEKLNAQTSAAILSTGSAAGKTLDEINKMNSSLEKLTGIEAEVIQEGQNMLLTFTKITGKQFDQATEAALDLSVALGKDMQSAALLVGKALNDPIAGVGALSKAGVQLTKDQKDTIAQMVEMNDVAGAQSIILEELNKQFGGSAEAFGETTAGKLAKVENLFGEMGETVAIQLLPALERFADAATLILEKNGPDIEKALSGVVDLVIDVVDGFIDFSNWWSDNPNLFNGIVIGLGAVTAAMIGLNIAMAANPIGLVIALLVGVVAAVTFAATNMERYGTYFVGVWNMMSGGVLKAVGTIYDSVAGMVNGIVDGINKLIDVINLLGVNVKRIDFKMAGVDFGGAALAEKGARQFTSTFLFGRPSSGGSGFGNPAFGNMPRFATGGIVTGPTVGLVGEAGPEAIIPLSRLGGMGGGQTVNVTVNTVAGDPVAIERVVLDAISRASRRGTTRLAV